METSNGYRSSYLYGLIICMACGVSCSSENDSEIDRYTAEMVAERSKLHELEPDLAIVDTWRHFDTKNGFKVYLPETAAVREKTISVNNYEGYQIMAWVDPSMAQSPTSVYLAGLDDSDPAHDVFEHSKVDARQLESGDVRKLNDAVKRMATRSEGELFASLFALLTSSDAARMVDKYEAVVLLAGNYYSSELGDVLWHIKNDHAECYAGVSLANADGSKHYLYGWVLDATGQSRVHFSITVSRSDFVKKDFESLLVMLVCNLSFDQVE